MDDLTNKYLKRIKVYFMIFGVFGCLFMFTIGLMFFLMDVTAKFYQFILILAIPAVYLLTGLFIRVKNKFIWILALILSILPLIQGIPSLLKNQPKSLIDLAGMVVFQPAYWEVLFGILILVHVMKPAVIKYYF